VPHLIQHLALAAALEIFFQFQRTIEMVLDRTFASAGDDDDVFDARRDRFFDHVLNQRFVDQREHLFRRGLGRGEKACAQSGSGNNGFTYIGSNHRGIVCEGVGEVKISSALFSRDMALVMRGNSFTLKNVVNIIREFFCTCAVVLQRKRRIGDDNGNSSSVPAQGRSVRWSRRDSGRGGFPFRNSRQPVLAFPGGTEGWR